MKLVLAVCSMAAAFVAAGEEWSFDVEAEALICAVRVEKVRKGEKRRDDVRLGPVFTGLFLF